MTRPRLALFDCDGTLVDSAPDLAGATNEMLLARGLPEVPFEHLRPMVGAGARGMMGMTCLQSKGCKSWRLSRRETSVERASWVSRSCLAGSGS